MKIKSCMNPDIRSINAAETLQQAARIMWEADCGALPVLDDHNQAIGMITDRDIAMAGFIQGLPLSDIPVNSVMSKTLVSIGPEQDLSEAEHLMQANQLRRLPVLNGKKQLVGILSLNDIATAYKRDSGKQVKANEVADTLASICIHRTLVKNSAVA
ncbi:CBS domain-containing protein [Arsukibacterium sp.]|uniref:CBS domain-containing protein n=1 Tax=Arsukibacterium sp. TaxID=1977258 RepID=UPI003563C3F5